MNPPKASHKLIWDQADRIGPWVMEKAGGVFVPGSSAIGVEVDGEILVGIAYDGYTGSNVCMHSRCDDPRATSKQFYWMIFDYPFNQLKVDRITVLVSSANQRAIKVDEKLGFRREATLSDYFSDGDGIVYVMRREDCRFIQGMQHGKQNT